MVMSYDAEQLSVIEAEDALADEFCVWVRSWQTVPAQGSTPERVVSGMRLEALLGIGRNRIVGVMNNRLHGERGWRQANHRVRRAWLANRERWLPMGLAELEAEKEERDRKKEAAALGAETEVHDGDAPYAIAGDDGVEPDAGVVGDSISVESSPGVAGSPQEEGVQPDAEQSDEAGVNGVNAPVNVTPDAPAVPTDEQAAGAMIGDVPIDEVDASGVYAPAGDGNAAAGDVNVPVNAPAEDVDAEDEEGDIWAEAAGADLEEMVTIIDVRNAQKAFSIEVGGRLSDTIAPRSPSGATSV